VIAGLTSRALAAWAGTTRLPIVAARRAELAARPVTPASAALALFVAGVDVDRALLRIDDARLVDASATRLRARVAILPVERALVVCDRIDVQHERVCWPDDSSYHLAAAIPAGRRDAWLDLGTGSAFAPLARPELATHIVGVELDPRAVAYARLGAELSGVVHLDVREADIAAPIAERFALVTCNAPIPQSTGPMWRATTADFVARAFAAAGAAVAAGGLVVVHAALDALEPVVAALPGERVIVTYTPDDVARAFAVAWWRPDAPARLVRTRRALTLERPHVDAADYSIAAT
jgi:methylase of polypeptide subunit release factors